MSTKNIATAIPFEDRMAAARACLAGESVVFNAKVMGRVGNTAPFRTLHVTHCEAHPADGDRS